ncbi:hypothetical protein KFL_004120010 [Klebsormidium nitens]|uniref:Uncharacterized protein n=1 Tax=Klebsormidium nitens TaxID=105231 RepID=A0A1Y1IB88_KLENI|nr:hypothetical protein KFL_004120010 [Klebsormidium nitens]|eukprot:GAQ88234.1 hypothetical protein KFL_004120010 [Klebsormidium nitens]
MHAAKVKGQRDAEDFIEDYPAIAEGPPRGRFISKSEEEVFEDHRRSSVLRCMGARQQVSSKRHIPMVRGRC